MKKVYLLEEERHIRLADKKFDKIPAKSTFIDHNKSDFRKIDGFEKFDMDFFMSLCPRS